MHKINIDPLSWGISLLNSHWLQVWPEEIWETLEILLDLIETVAAAAVAYSRDICLCLCRGSDHRDRIYCIVASSNAGY